MPNDKAAPTIDITWLSRIACSRHDRPTSTWLPPRQRLVGPPFNDPERPDWMDEAEWTMRAHSLEAPALRASSTRLKSILCESSMVNVTPEVIRKD